MIILVLGLMITVYIHFYYTGKWFVFFEAQLLWKNYLHFPHLPLKSWGGDDCTRFDGSALAVSLLCGAYIISLFLKKLKVPINITKDLAFAILYTFGTGLIILAYRDGNLYSLNRFIYATPFIFVILQYFLDSYTFNRNHVWLVVIISEMFWLIFNSYNHIHNFLLFSTVTLYFALILWSKHSNKVISALSILGLIIINSIGIIKLLYRFLNNGWVG